jgi:hypothetical protein
MKYAELPDWTFSVEEVSAGVYEVTATDNRPSLAFSSALAMPRPITVTALRWIAGAVLLLGVVLSPLRALAAKTRDGVRGCWRWSGAGSADYGIAMARVLAAMTRSQ